MAIKVSGTTVVDDSRNLQNLVNLNTSGNVYANTFVGDADQLTNLPASGGSFEAIASGTLSDGSTVIVNADGTVSAVGGDPYTASLGSRTTFDSGQGEYVNGVYDPDQQKVILVYRDAGNSYKGTAIVGTITGTSISFGTAVVFNGVTTGEMDTCYDTDQDKVVIVFNDSSGSNAVEAVVGTVSGTSISFGSTVSIGSGTSTTPRVAYSPDQQKVLVVYNLSGTDIRAKVGTVSGTSISFGSAGTLVSSATASGSALTYDTVAQKFVFAYKLNTNSYGYAVVATVSGTSVTFGTPVQFSAGYVNYSIGVAYHTDQNKIVIGYTDQNNSYYGTGIVGTVSGTSISFGTATVWNSSFTYNSDTSNAVAYHEPSNGIYITGADNGDGTRGKYGLGTVSGTSISFGSAVTFSSDNSPGPAVIPTDNTLVFAHKNDTTFNSTCKVWQPAYTPTNLTSENFIGISNGAYANNVTATVQIKGAVDDAQSGLTPGQQYFVQANGSINTTAANPSVFAGTAIASNKLIVKG